MSRIQAVAKENESEEQRALLDGFRKGVGSAPNLLRVLAHSPAALRSYLEQSSALREGVLSSELADQLAVTVSGANGCDYCASAHSLSAEEAGVSRAELARNLHGEAQDERTAAVLDFSRLVVANRGVVQDEDVQALREAGFTTTEVVEVMAHIGMNLFTNYFNQVMQTEVDFPAVCTIEARIRV